MFRAIQNRKIGNILIYLSKNIHDKYSQNLYLTKTLKLLYIIDETAVKETGAPVTWLEYKVWENGPVAKEIHAEFRHGEQICFHNVNISFDSFVETKKTLKDTEEWCQLIPRVSFDDSLFSDYEIQLLDRIVTKYGKLSSPQLIKILHKENSLWDIEKQKHNLEFSLQNQTSDYSINFIDLIKDDNYKKEIYKSSFESMNMQLNLA
jgi:uncharacterized phage-associated protein